MRVKVLKEAVWRPATRVYDIEKNEVAELQYPDYINSEDTHKFIKSYLNGTNEAAGLAINAAIESIIDPESEGEIVESAQAEGGIIARANADGISFLLCRLNSSGNWICTPESVEKNNMLYGDIAGEKPKEFYDRETGRVVDRIEDVNGEKYGRYIYAEHDNRIREYDEVVKRLVEKLKNFDSMIAHADKVISENPQMIENVNREIEEKRDASAIVASVGKLLGNPYTTEYARKALYKKFGEIRFK